MYKVPPLMQQQVQPHQVPPNTEVEKGVASQVVPKDSAAFSGPMQQLTVV